MPSGNLAAGRAFSSPSCVVSIDAFVLRERGDKILPFFLLWSFNYGPYEGARVEGLTFLSLPLGRRDGDGPRIKIEFSVFAGHKFRPLPHSSSFFRYRFSNFLSLLFDSDALRSSCLDGGLRRPHFITLSGFSSNPKRKPKFYILLEVGNLRPRQSCMWSWSTNGPSVDSLPLPICYVILEGSKKGLFFFFI